MIQQATRCKEEKVVNVKTECECSVLQREDADECPQRSKAQSPRNKDDWVRSKNECRSRTCNNRNGKRKQDVEDPVGFARSEGRHDWRGVADQVQQQYVKTALCSESRPILFRWRQVGHLVGGDGSVVF